jgi:hypothetical protein
VFWKNAPFTPKKAYTTRGLFQRHNCPVTNRSRACSGLEQMMSLLLSTIIVTGIGGSFFILKIFRKLRWGFLFYFLINIYI